MNDLKLQNYLNVYYQLLDTMAQQMLSAPITTSVSVDFILMMIPHHQMAIEMCAQLLKYTQEEALQEIAFNIIKQQTISIKNMLKIKNTCQKVNNLQSEVLNYHQEMETIIYQMISQMQNAGGTNINQAFICEMIPHHEGAIKMSKQTLNYQICQELKPILQSTITLQQQGIQELKQLLSGNDNGSKLTFG